MPHLKWAPRALRDLVRLEAFLHEHDPAVALRARARILASVEILRDQAMIGRRVDGFSASVREWPIRFGAAGYVARYQIRDDGDILIAAVRHMREKGFDDI